MRTCMIERMRHEKHFLNELLAAILILAPLIGGLKGINSQLCTSIYFLLYEVGSFWVRSLESSIWLDVKGSRVCKV